MIRVVHEKAIIGNMSTIYYCVTFVFKLLNLPQNQDGSNKMSESSLVQLLGCCRNRIQLYEEGNIYDIL